MQAILELWNRGGFKVKVEFVLNKNLTIDYQVNKIASNFTDLQLGRLRFKGAIKEHDLMFEFEGG